MKEEEEEKEEEKEEQQEQEEEKEEEEPSKVLADVSSLRCALQQSSSIPNQSFRFLCHRFSIQVTVRLYLPSAYWLVQVPLSPANLLFFPLSLSARPPARPPARGT